MDKQEKSEINSKIKRIDAKYISHEVQHLFHIEKGYLYTIKQLLLKPGKTVRDYLNVNREKYVKPIVFLIFTAIIFTIVFHFFHVDYNYFNLKDFGPAIKLEKILKVEYINEWTNEHLGYSALITAFFVALWVKIFFYKREYNIFEIFVLMSYVYGIWFFIILLFTLISIPLQTNIFAKVGIIISELYIVWGIGQFFGEKKISNYLKAFFSYLLGFNTYKLVLLLVAYMLK